MNSDVAWRRYSTVTDNDNIIIMSGFLRHGVHDKIMRNVCSDFLSDIEKIRNSRKRTENKTHYHEKSGINSQYM